MRKKREGIRFEDDPRKIIIYGRQSKARKRGCSIENQVTECKRKCYYRWGNIPDEDFIILDKDEGISGHGTDNRPDFNRAVQLVQQNKIKAVVAYKFDRMNRNTRDFLNFVAILDEHDCKFVSATQDFDSQTSEGRLLMTMMAGVSEWERDVDSERIADNLYELARKGYWLGGTPPTGYDHGRKETFRTDGKATTYCYLIDKPEELKTPELLFRKYLEMKSQCELEQWTMLNGIKSKKGKYYTRTSIKRILQNPTYCIADQDAYEYFESKGSDIAMAKELWDGKHGVLAYNKSDRANGYYNIDVANTDDWIVSIGEHSGIVSGKDWVETQEILTKNANKNFRKPLKNTSILTGLIRCKHCGCLMVAKVTQRLNEDGKLRFDYCCPTKLRTKGQLCNCHNLNGNNLDKLVLDAVKDLFKPDAEFAQALKKMASDTAFVESNRVAELREVEKRYKANEEAYNGLLEKLKLVPAELMNDITESMVTLKKANEEYAKKIRELKAEGEGVVEDSDTAKLILKLSKNYLDTFETLDVLTQRNFIRLFVTSIETDGENVDLNLLSPEKNPSDVLPRNNRR